MNVEPLSRTHSSNANFSSPGLEQGVPTPLTVLKELFQLLEDYAPAWYTEELHNRAVAALRTGSH